MPGWLGAITTLNPLSAATASARARSETQGGAAHRGRVLPAIGRGVGGCGGGATEAGDRVPQNPWVGWRAGGAGRLLSVIGVPFVRMLWAAGVWFPRARAPSPLATAINTNDLSLVLDERLALPRLEGYPSDEQKRDREETVMLLEQFQQRYPGGLPVSVDGAQMRHGAGLDQLSQRRRKQQTTHALVNCTFRLSVPPLTTARPSAPGSGTGGGCAPAGSSSTRTERWEAPAANLDLRSPLDPLPAGRAGPLGGLVAARTRTTRSTLQEDDPASKGRMGRL